MSRGPLYEYWSANGWLENDVQPHDQSVEAVKSENWKPPDYGFVKCDVDAAFCAESFSARLSALFRDYRISHR